MANVSAVVESNKHLTDRVIEMSKEAQKPQPAAAPAPMDQANTRAVEVIADAATRWKMMLDDPGRAAIADKGPGPDGVSPRRDGGCARHDAPARTGNSRDGNAQYDATHDEAAGRHERSDNQPT